METVSVADLKNDLSAYLEKVRHGEELVVKDGNHPIARVLPLRSEVDYELEEEALVAAGLLRLPTEKLPKDFWNTPAPKVAMEKLRAAIRR